MKRSDRIGLWLLIVLLTLLPLTKGIFGYRLWLMRESALNRILPELGPPQGYSAAQWEELRQVLMLSDDGKVTLLMAGLVAALAFVGFWVFLWDLMIPGEDQKPAQHRQRD